MPCSHCTTWFTQGFSVCPACKSQRPEAERERQAAERFLSTHPVPERVRALLERRILNRAETGEGGVTTRRALARNPHRREAFRLTGLYFTEDEASDLLAAISEHRWIEAEKAGRDIWVEKDPSCPRCAATRDWMSRFFPHWAQWRLGQSPSMC